MQGMDIIIHQPDEVLNEMDEWCTTHHGQVSLSHTKVYSRSLYRQKIFYNCAIAQANLKILSTEGLLITSRFCRNAVFSSHLAGLEVSCMFHK